MMKTIKFIQATHGGNMFRSSTAFAGIKMDFLTVDFFSCCFKMLVFDTKPVYFGN